MVRPRERETTDEGEKEESTEGVMGEGKEAKDSGVSVKEEVEGEEGGMLVTWIQEQRSGRHFDGPAVE
jgi:hypothetical protein